MTLASALTGLQWTLSTFLGWLVGIVMIVVLSGVLESIGIEGFQFYVGVGMGAGVGLMQWFRLRRFGIGIVWVWSSLCGFGAAFLIYDLNVRYSGFPLGSLLIPVCVLVGAVAASYMQVRGAQAPRVVARQWLVRNTLGWILAALMVSGVAYTRTLSTHVMVVFFVNLLLILLGGVVLGVITAPTIMKFANSRG